MQRIGQLPDAMERPGDLGGEVGTITATRHHLPQPHLERVVAGAPFQREAAAFA